MPADNASRVLSRSVSSLNETMFMYKQALLDLRGRFSDVPRCLRGRYSTSLLVASLAILASCTLMFLGYPTDFSGADGACPRLWMSHSDQQYNDALSENGPTALLTAAKQANLSQEWGEEALAGLRRCISWKPAFGSVASSREMKAQLTCHGALLQRPGPTPPLSERLALLEHGAGLLRIVEAASRQCDVLRQHLASRRVEEAGTKEPIQALAALAKWARFEPQLLEALDILGRTVSVIQERVAADDWDAQDASYGIQSLRIRFRGCALRASREARLIASQLQPSQAVTKTENCISAMLAKMECASLIEGDKDMESGVVYNRGLLLSEMAMAHSDSPFFGGAPSCCFACNGTSPDEQNHHVPSGIALAEVLLSRGYESSYGPDRTERGVLRTIQLCKHANYLAHANSFDIDVDWRYHTAVALATENGRQRLAANVLGKFSSFLSSKGRPEEALEAADKAMLIDPDPVASFQQARLRFELSKLKSGSEVMAAAQQLLAIEPGRLSQNDEKMRVSLGAQLLHLHEAVEAESLSACLGLGDVSQVLACTFGRAFYA